MVRFDQGGSSFRCSGTLIAPTVVLTWRSPQRAAF
jgi:hypothetical protein